MVIQDLRKCQKVTVFRDLLVQDCFEFRGEIWMKVLRDDYGHAEHAVRLSNGVEEPFDLCAQVYQVHGRIVIERNA